MKDKHGIQRGRCGELNCECEQYWPPPPDSAGGKLYCEYCNHLPGRHLRIVPLGACWGCGQKDNCTKYEPANDWSYSECQYCGCAAKCHEGAQHLTPSSQQSGASPSVRLSPSGTPVQTYANGQCKCQGCPHGRRLDPTTGHILDYCSKTCAVKDNAGQSSSGTTSGASSGVASADPGLIKQLLTPLGARLLSTFQGSAMPSSATANPNTSSLITSSPVTQPSISGPKCTNCNSNPANPGRKWCQKCFLATSPSSMSSPAPPSST